MGLPSSDVGSPASSKKGTKTVSIAPETNQQNGSPIKTKDEDQNVNETTEEPRDV